MAQQEKYNNRDMTYSNWHRYPNLDKSLSWIDIDACEYCDNCKEPLALIELAVDIGQPHKTATVTRNLAKKANIPAYVALYKLGDNTVRNGDLEHQEIVDFRMKRIAPDYTDWRKFSPAQYAGWLADLRERHNCDRGK